MFDRPFGRPGPPRFNPTVFRTIFSRFVFSCCCRLLQRTQAGLPHANALFRSRTLVARRLRRSASRWHGLHTCRQELLNVLRISIDARGLLICGLWVRFPPGSPLIPQHLAQFFVPHRRPPVARGLQPVASHPANRPRACATRPATSARRSLTSSRRRGAQLPGNVSDRGPVLQRPLPLLRGSLVLRPARLLGRRDFCTCFG